MTTLTGQGQRPGLLTVLQHNIAGARRQRYELIDLLTQHDVHVCCLNETLLKPQHPFSIPGYFVYRQDRPTPGGGLAILIKKSLSHHEFPIPPLKTLETQAIILKTASTDILITNIYLHPRTILDKTDIDVIRTLNPNLILAGDFNAKHPTWNTHPLPNPSANILHEYLNNNPQLVFIAPNVPTRPCSLSTIDLILTTLRGGHEQEVIYAIHSDHLPVCTKFYIKPYRTTVRYWTQYQDFD